VIDRTANISCVFQDNIFVLQIIVWELNLLLAIGASFYSNNGPSFEFSRSVSVCQPTKMSQHGAQGFS